MRKSLFIGAASAALAMAAAACGSSDPTVTPTTEPSPSPTQTSQPTPEAQNFNVAFSTKERVMSPSVPGASIDTLVNGNTTFALNLYRQLSAEDGNLFMSPYSISLALAMTYAGADDETRAEMAQTLGFGQSGEDLHEAFNALDQLLAERGADLPEDERFTLEIANSTWGQDGFGFQEIYLDVLAEHYGAGMRTVDYVQAAEEARLAINAWVEDNTNGRIKDLVPEGALDDMTRLVLANAIYFKASWLQEFNEDLTSEADFFLPGGGIATVSMMRRLDYFNYGEGDGYQAIEIPYVGNETSMVVLLPADGELSEFESSLDAEKLNEIIDGMDREYGTLNLPKFEFESKFSLPDQLKALGMEQAFDSNAADFSGISDEAQLYISDVIHQSFVSVDEQGTEAAAATAVIISATSAPVESFEFVADSPFIFLIRDIETGTVLFMGRFQGPEA